MSKVKDENVESCQIYAWIYGFRWMDTKFLCFSRTIGIFCTYVALHNIIGLFFFQGCSSLFQHEYYLNYSPDKWVASKKKYLFKQHLSFLFSLITKCRKYVRVGILFRQSNNSYEILTAQRRVIRFSRHLIHFPIILSAKTPCTPPSSKRRALFWSAGRVAGWQEGICGPPFSRALFSGNHIIQKSGSVLLAVAIFHSCGCLWHLADTPRPREIHSAKERCERYWSAKVGLSCSEMFSFHSLIANARERRTVFLRSEWMMTTTFLSSACRFE